MSSSLDADIWVGCYWETDLFNKEVLLEEGVEIEKFIDEDGNVDLYDLLEAVNKGFDCNLEYSIICDSDEIDDRIIGFNLTSDGYTAWEAKEIDLTRLMVAEQELSLLLKHLFKDDVDIKTYLVPSYF